MLLAVADALGDGESLGAVFDAKDLQVADHCDRRYQPAAAGGRVGEALAVVRAVKLDGREWMASLAQRSSDHSPGGPRPRCGGPAAAPAAGAAGTPHPRHLRSDRNRLPAIEEGEAEEKACDLVEADPHNVGDLKFLLAWPVRRRAAALVLAPADTLESESSNLRGPSPSSCRPTIARPSRCCCSRGCTSPSRWGAPAVTTTAPGTCAAASSWFRPSPAGSASLPTPFTSTNCAGATAASTAPGRWPTSRADPRVQPRSSVLVAGLNQAAFWEHPNL